MKKEEVVVFEFEYGHANGVWNSSGAHTKPLDTAIIV